MKFKPFLVDDLSQNKAFFWKNQGRYHVRSPLYNTLNSMKIEYVKQIRDIKKHTSYDRKQYKNK